MDGTTDVLTAAIRSQPLRAQSQAAIHGPSDFSWSRIIEISLDAVTVFACLQLGCLLARMKHLVMLAPVTDHAYAVTLVSSLVMVMLLDRAGAYQTSGGLLHIRETASVLESVFIATALVIPCVLLAKAPWCVLFALFEAPLVASALVLQKHMFHTFLSRIRQSGTSRHRVFIYGDSNSARLLYAALTRSPKLGVHPIALIAETPSADSSAQSTCGAGVHQVTTLPYACFSASLLREHRADMVIISSPLASASVLQRITDVSAEADVQVLYTAERAPVGGTEIDLIELDGQFVYGEHRVRRRRLHEALSRGLDVLVSTLMLLGTALPIMIVALAIRVESDGPILFRQIRIGHNGVPFTILKFRTMHHTSCSDSFSPVSSADPRITRVGRLLRRTSLDELPQLLNVLRGDMALVGPRPEMPFIVCNYSDAHRQRLSVKPGLTGLWQISAARRYPIHDNIHYDLYYVKHRSLAVDVALLLHTFFFALHGI